MMKHKKYQNNQHTHHAQKYDYDVFNSYGVIGLALVMFVLFHVLFINTFDSILILSGSFACAFILVIIIKRNKHSCYRQRRYYRHSYHLPVHKTANPITIKEMFKPINIPTNKTLSKSLVEIPSPPIEMSSKPTLREVKLVPRIHESGSWQQNNNTIGDRDVGHTSGSSPTPCSVSSNKGKGKRYIRLSSLDNTGSRSSPELPPEPSPDKTNKNNRIHIIHPNTDYVQFADNVIEPVGYGWGISGTIENRLPNPDHHNSQRKCDDDEHTPRPYDISDVFDPRFYGYGAMHRAHFDESDAIKYNYSDIDSYKHPQNPVRSLVDHIPHTTQFNTARELHEKVDSDFHNSQMEFRTDMSARQMRKIIARQEQKRNFPLRPY